MSDAVLAVRPCPICSCSIDIEFDPHTHAVRLISTSVPPLAKDKLAIVLEYRRIKGLGLDWDAKHRPRAIVYAQGILEAIGNVPTAAALAVEAVGWVGAHSAGAWDLGDVQSKVGQFLKARSEAQYAERKSGCSLCDRLVIEGGTFCANHSWCRVCEETIPHGKSHDDGHFPICASCHQKEG